MLREMDSVLREATGLPISIAEEPLFCVVMGNWPLSRGTQNTTACIDRGISVSWQGAIQRSAQANLKE